MDIIRRGLYSATTIVLDQDYENVQSILLNLGIVSALLLSILIGLVMSIPVEESARGDILSLSLSSPHFRCHFASVLNTTTIEMCSPNFTMAVFGSTKASVICNRDYESVQRIPENKFRCLYNPSTAIRRRIPEILGSWRPTNLSMITDNGFGCSSSTFQDAFRVARNISNDDYLEYAIKMMTASSDPATGVALRHYNLGDCQPSAMVSLIGFLSMFSLALALFLDLYLLISLSLTAAHKNKQEMILWWSSGGGVVTIIVVWKILDGTLNFMGTLGYVANIRFPFPYDQLLFRMDFKDRLWEYATFSIGSITSLFFAGSINWKFVVTTNAIDKKEFLQG